MKKKTVLIIGSGGREYALGWKIKQSPVVEKIYFAPGNGGTKDLGENIPIKVEAVVDLLHFAQENQIGLTVVGPEVPLALGIVDEFIKKGLRIFGPTKAAAQLETSKTWAIRFMQENGIPHPISEFFRDVSSALNYIRKLKGRCVVKADGLAAGKGVFVCNNIAGAKKSIKDIMIDKVFGEAGNTLIIQEKLVGREVSVRVFCDGKIAIPIVPAQDYKRAFDHDLGPNTGGMGAFAPASLSPRLLKKMHQLLQLTIERMNEKNMPYIGVLYGGFMIVENEPYVLEFNCRMGDPETQVQLPLLSSDVVLIMEACIDGKLRSEMVEFSHEACVCVVLAAEGYQGKYEKGVPIYGLDAQNGIMTFHAGTEFNNGKLVTSGGRIVGIAAKSSSMQDARDKVYSVIGNPIHFEDMQYRSDIGKVK